MIPSLSLSVTLTVRLFGLLRSALFALGLSLLLALLLLSTLRLVLQVRAREPAQHLVGLAVHRVHATRVDLHTGEEEKRGDKEIRNGKRRPESKRQREDSAQWYGSASAWRTETQRKLMCERGPAGLSVNDQRKSSEKGEGRRTLQRLAEEMRSAKRESRQETRTIRAQEQEIATVRAHSHLASSEQPAFWKLVSWLGSTLSSSVKWSVSTSSQALRCVILPSERA